MNLRRGWPVVAGVFVAAFAIPFVVLGRDIWLATIFALCDTAERNPVYGGLAVSSFARVEHPDDRHPDDCCRAVPEVTVPIPRAVGRNEKDNRKGDCATMLDEFAALELKTAETTIFVRRGGSGPPVLLLHGFPQTHLTWRDVARALSARFTVVCVDLRGYGWSGCPVSDATHRAYSKRSMARDMVAVMEQLGFSRFSVAGHDRDGRVAYRLALDHPAHVEPLAVLDIVPTAEDMGVRRREICNGVLATGRCQRLSMGYRCGLNRVTEVTSEFIFRQ